MDTDAGKTRGTGLAYRRSIAATSSSTSAGISSRRRRSDARAVRVRPTDLEDFLADPARER